MSNMLSKVVNDDFVWSAVASALTGGRRGSHGDTMINCPMCVTRGETPDKRHRCGVGRRADGLIIHCYNCGFATKYKIGEVLSKNMRNFLERIGVPTLEVQRINYKALQYRRMIANSPDAQAIIPISVYKPSFQTISMPDGAMPLGEWADNGVEDSDFFDVAAYLFQRGDVVAGSMPFYWTPLTEHNLNRRLLFPFVFEGRIVGWTGRLIDPSSDTKPKYFSSVPSHFLFNNEVLDTENMFVPLVEGPLDAAVVDGVATLGAKLSDEQARWLNSTGKQIVVVADRDKSGQRLIDRAVENNWMVAFPKLKDGHGFHNWWDSDIKDCAAASQRYGKLYTVRSIIETATANKLEINIKRKLLY